MKTLHVRITYLIPCAIVASLALIVGGPAQTQELMVSNEIQTDGQILQILWVMNDGEILQAEMAVTQSEDATLTDTARTLISDHRTSNDRISAIVATGIDLEESPLSAALQVESTKVIESMSGLSGNEFACRYLEHQIVQHEHALEHLMPQLETRAQSDAVRELVSFSTPVIERHLLAARTPMQVSAGC